LDCNERNQVESTKVGEKREPQVDELDQLKLKTDVLHRDRDGEVHMTQLIGFVAEKSISVVKLNGARLDKLCVV